MKALWVAFGAYTTVWGLWLLSPWWTVFSTRAGLYDQMNEFMPEWGWGLHAVAIGACILYGACCSWPRGIWFGHIAGMYHWGLISVFYFMGDWHNTGWITSLALVVMLHLIWKEAKRQNPASVHP